MGKRILIVDDDALLRDFYSKVITSEGYTPVAVGNGDDAIAELEKDSNFVLAIIDLLMPVRTGWELIEHMKGNDKYQDIPVIALTGLAASFNEFQKVEDVCDGVMHKGSFELPEFTAKIKSIVEKKKASR
ncbi:MAG: response regulator [Victivallales bacterium]|nr:response regulator [Victivallales bacterium]